jgi:GNAT superfamily N-acetyltransferase
LRRGDVCIGVREHKTPVGYIWFAFGSAPHIHGAWVRVEPRARYLYKAFLRPAYRGRRISPELYIRASEICPRRGRTLGILTVYADNLRGLKASHRAGWIDIGCAGFLRCLGALLAFRSPGTRKYGFSFFWRS